RCTSAARAVVVSCSTPRVSWSWRRSPTAAAAAAAELKADRHGRAATEHVQDGGRGRRAVPRRGSAQVRDLLGGPEQGADPGADRHVTRHEGIQEGRLTNQQEGAPMSLTTEEPLIEASALAGFPGAPFSAAQVRSAADSLRTQAGWHIAPT